MEVEDDDVGLLRELRISSTELRVGRRSPCNSVRHRACCFLIDAKTAM
jgi:hypothetical protein